MTTIVFHDVDNRKLSHAEAEVLVTNFDTALQILCSLIFFLFTECDLEEDVLV